VDVNTSIHLVRLSNDIYIYTIIVTLLKQPL